MRPKTAAALRDSSLEAVLVGNPVGSWHDVPVMTPDFDFLFRAGRGPTVHAPMRELFST